MRRVPPPLSHGRLVVLLGALSTSSCWLGGLGVLVSVVFDLGLASLLPSFFVLVASIGFVLPNAAALALAEHPRRRQRVGAAGARTVRHRRDRRAAGGRRRLAQRAAAGDRGGDAVDRRTGVPCRVDAPRWGGRDGSGDPRCARIAGMTYVPAEDRYDAMPYRRCGRSGLQLPAISFGLWQNFGDERPLETSRAIVRRAFDLGITHFDLANNYGPPYGSAEINFGRILAEDLRPWRDELVISTKAGYDMWPGPYGEWGSRKYLLASLDQSLKRMGLEYVDIFYSHRLDPDTPLEETLGALDTAVRQGKALYAGISSYSAERTAEAVTILRELGTPLLIHQPSYSLLNRWIEPDLLDVLGREGAGCIVFSPLGQGMLTDRYLDGVPEDSRAAREGSLSQTMLSDENLARIRALNDIAQRRGQTLAQLALAWTLRDPRVTSTLIGASSVAQLEQNLGALARLDFDDDELAEVDRYAVDAGINIWERSSTA
jgi:L-glyceraldehyde 3-phosphate reductase